MFGMKKNAPESTGETNYAATVSGVEKVTKKGVGRKVAIISGISAAVLVGGGAAAYNLSPFVKNQVKLRVMKPENYYAWVYDENGQELADKISEGYEKYLTRYENGQRTSIRLEYEPTEEALQIFRDEFDLTDENGLEEAERNLLKAINDTNKLGIDLDVYQKRGDMQFTASAGRNDVQLVSFDLMTTAGYDLFMRVPQLTEQWLGISLSDVLNEAMYSNPENQDIMNTLSDLKKDPRSFLSPEELREEILKYVGVWNDSVSGVRIKNSEEVEINGVTVKYTVASVKLNRKKGYEIVNNFLETARDDEIIRGLLVDKLGVIDEDDYNSFFEEAFEDFELDDDDEDDENVTFRTFIDSKGVIRGFEVKRDSENRLIAAIGKNGKKVGGEISLTSYGEKEFEINLYAEEVGKDEYSGSIDFITEGGRYDFDLDEYVYEDEKYTIEFEDFSIANEEYNYFNADLTIISPELDQIKLSFDAGSDHQSVTFELVEDGINYGKLTLTGSIEEDVELPIPDRSDSFMIDLLTDGAPDLMQYVDRAKMKTFIKDIILKLDMDEKFAEEIAEEAAAEVYDPRMVEEIIDDTLFW